MRFASGLLALQCVLGIGVTESLAQGTDWRLTLHGAGRVRVGMTIDEASRAADGEVYDAAKTWECDTWMPAEANQGVPGVPVFSIRDGMVAYATILFPEARTWRGARVGLTETAVQRLYGHRLESIPSPRGHLGHRWLIYVPLTPADSAYRMVFETDGHRVTSIMAGAWPFAFELEGCSTAQ
ncbi:MAG TPA: hypothetical protein VNO19_04545 [Gemmatimonadales bacterium]|nr:hypothetical protein [Gemmatimonadales bacterium]